MVMSRYIAIFSSSPADTLSLARSLSPRVEVHPTGGIVLETPDRYEESTLDRLTQYHAAMGRIDFGAASTRTAALFAARAKPGSVIPTGREAEFMAPFPIDLLSLHEREIANGVLGTLSRWGIHTLGQLALLPSAELLSRFGEIGARLQKLAKGEDLLPFQPVVEPVRFEAGLELDWEIDSLEPLTFILGRLLDQLCGQLESRGLATDRLRIVLRLGNGVFHERAVPLAFPMRQPKTLLSLLRLKLQSDSPKEPIRAVRLEARPTRPQTIQNSLLEPSLPHPEKLSRTLARLASLTGEEPLGSPRPLDTHRPDAFQVNPFLLTTRRSLARRRAGNANHFPNLTLKRLRPPTSFSMRTEQVVACAGPWRVSGEWWENGNGPNGWSRDEWDVEFVDGRICRVFWDGRRKQWFLEGIYD